MDDRPATPSFPRLVARAVCAVAAASAVLGLASAAVRALAGNPPEATTLPWMLGDEPLALVACAPIALAALVAAIAVLRRPARRTDADGYARPTSDMWLALPVVWFGSRVGDPPMSLAESLHTAAFFGVIATALLRLARWEPARPPITRPRRAMVAGATLVAAALLAVPVAYAALHPIETDGFGLCERGRCDGAPATHLYVTLVNHGRTHVTLASIAPDDLPDAVEVRDPGFTLVEERPDGDLRFLTQDFVDLRPPIMLPPRDEILTYLRLRLALRRPCPRAAEATFRIERVRLRYEVRGRELETTEPLDEPVLAVARCLPAARH